MTTRTCIPAADALKYAAALLDARTGWALDSIAGSMCNHGDCHEDAIEAVHDVVLDVRDLAARYGDPHRYHDGRAVKTDKEIAYGLTTSHVWHPDPSYEKPLSWRANLPSDPDMPSPGVYEVSTDPATQEIHVRVVRIVPAATYRPPLDDPDEDLPTDPSMNPW